MRLVGAVQAAEAELITQFQRARYFDLPEAAEMADFLVRSNASLVRRAVRRERTRRVDVAELEQAATVGLLVALRRFRPVAGAPFAAYAHHWMRKELQRCVAAAGFGLAVPANRAGLLRGAAAQLSEKPGLEDAGLASAMHVSTATAAGLRTVLEVHSLAAGQEASVPDTVDGVVNRAGVDAALQRLDPMTRAIVRMRYGFDGAGSRSHRQIARLLGISDFTVRHRLRKAHDVLRRLLS
jgi:RNA polymerase sigma-B factor